VSRRACKWGGGNLEKGKNFVLWAKSNHIGSRPSKEKEKKHKKKRQRGGGNGERPTANDGYRHSTDLSEIGSKKRKVMTRQRDAEPVMLGYLPRRKSRRSKSRCWGGGKH